MASSRAITIEFLRSFPALHSKTDEQLNGWITILEEQGVETTANFDSVDRDDLLAARGPVLLVTVLKPKQQSGELRCCSRIQMLLRVYVMEDRD
jgi:hypothetical protein